MWIPCIWTNENVGNVHLGEHSCTWHQNDINVSSCLVSFFVAFHVSAKEVNGSTTRALGSRQRRDSKGSGIAQPADTFLYEMKLSFCLI